jgi:hypothetical protein
VIFAFLLTIDSTCIYTDVPTGVRYYTDQYSETNVMDFLFSLLRIKGFYVFRALHAHLQEALRKRHLVYCVRVMSVGCTRIGVESTSRWFHYTGTL